MSYTSNSEFENQHVFYTNELPPYDYYEGVHSLLTDDIWKWLLGYSTIEYDNDHKDIVDGLDTVIDTDFYHKTVNGSESQKYGPLSKEYCYEALSQESFIKVAEYSKIKNFDLATVPNIESLELKYEVRLSDLEPSAENADKILGFNKPLLKKAESIDLITEPGYLYIIPSEEHNIYDKYYLVSETVKEKEYRTLVKLGIKVRYEKYHTMELNGVLLPEEDLFLHEIYRYFETLYPDNPDWVDLLTNNEVNDAITNAAAMVNYKPDNRFFELVAANLEKSEDLAIREAFKIKLRNLTNNSYRRKLYGSRYGYRMFGADIFENLLVYPIGTYIPLQPLDIALSYNGFPVTDSNISILDSTLFEAVVPPKTLYNRYVNQYDEHYYNKFRLIDWTGSSHSLNVEKQNNYSLSFFSVPGFEKILFEDLYSDGPYIVYNPGMILDREGVSYIVDSTDQISDYRTVSLSTAIDPVYTKAKILRIKEDGATDILETNNGFTGAVFNDILAEYMKLHKDNVYDLDICSYPMELGAFLTSPKTNMLNYLKELPIGKDDGLNADLKVGCIYNGQLILEPPLLERSLLRKKDILYLPATETKPAQAYVIQGYERGYVDLKFDYEPNYNYEQASKISKAAIYAIAITTCNNETVILYGKITDLACSIETDEELSQPETCKFMITCIPEEVPEEFSDLMTDAELGKSNLEKFSYNDKLYTVYSLFDSETHSYNGLKLKALYTHDGTSYVKTKQFQTGTVTKVSYGYWKALPIYIDNGIIGSVYSPYSYGLKLEDGYIKINNDTVVTDLALSVNEKLLEHPCSFNFLDKALAENASSKYDYLAIPYQNLVIESDIVLGTNDENNVISFTTDYAKQLFKNLSVGDIVSGPGLPDVNDDIFITSLGDNQVTVNAILTKSGTFSLHYKCKLSSINMDNYAAEDDFEQRLANIGALEVPNPWKHGLYGSDSYPNVAGALLDGLTDISYYKPFTNEGGENYFTQVILPAIHGDKLEYYPILDKNGKKVASNQIIPCTIKYIGDTFIDISLNKLCSNPNRLGNTDNLITVEWLDYLTDNVLELSRASDKVQFGTHLLMETDSSGMMSLIDGARFTDPSVKVRIQTFNWSPNTVPAYAQIGTGGDSNFIEFNTLDQTSLPLVWGSSVWDDPNGITPERTLIMPTVDEREKNVATASSKTEEEIRATGIKGKGELRSRSIWSKSINSDNEEEESYITEIANPIAQTNLGEYDIQLHYNCDDPSSSVNVTTIQANFYKQSFKNIVKDTYDLKVAPRTIIDNNFILGTTDKVTALNKIYQKSDDTDYFSSSIAQDEFSKFIGPKKSYVCLGKWQPSIKNGKILWPSDISVLAKDYENTVYYYIIEQGATFLDVALDPDNDIDTRSDVYEAINTFTKYTVAFEDQSILTITPETTASGVKYRWSNKKLNLVGLFGDLLGSRVSSNYDVYPTYENTWLNVILHRGLGALTAFSLSNRIKGTGLTPWIGTFAFCPGFEGGYEADTGRQSLSSITDYLEAFARYYNDGDDNTGRYQVRINDVLAIDGTIAFNRINKTGQLAGLGSNIIVLSLVEDLTKASNSVVSDIYTALKPGAFGSFIAAIPEFDFGTKKIQFSIIELSADSFFVQNLKKDRSLLTSSEYQFLNLPVALWQKFNTAVTSSLALPRKLIAEGSYSFDLVVDPQFLGEVYNYDEYIDYLNGELSLEEVTTEVMSITTSAIFYNEAYDLFYIQTQELDKGYCEVTSVYNITVHKLILAMNSDGSRKYSIGDEPVLMVRVDINEDGTSSNYFINSNGEKILYRYDPITLNTTITLPDGEEKIVGTLGESIIALYENTLESVSSADISKIDVHFIVGDDQVVDYDKITPDAEYTEITTNIIDDLYKNSEFFRAIIAEQQDGVNVVDLFSEEPTSVAIFSKGVGTRVSSGNYTVKLPVSGTEFDSRPSDTSNTVIIKKYVISFNENKYYKNIKYLTCNYQLVKSQITGEEALLETPTLTKVDGEAFDVRGLSATDRLLKMTSIQLRPIESPELQPTFFSSFTKLKGQLVNIDNHSLTAKITYDIGSLVFPNGKTDTTDQMVTLGSRSDFSSQLMKLLPAYTVNNSDTQDDDLIVYPNNIASFPGLTWNDNVYNSPEVVDATVSSVFKVEDSPTMEFKYFKNLLLVEASVSGDNPASMTLVGNSADAVTVLDTDDIIVSAIPLVNNSGEYSKTCAIYFDIGGYQAPLSVNYVYHGNGYLVAAYNTDIYYAKIPTLEGLNKVILHQGISLGSYDGYRVTDIAYADNYFYITLSNSANERIIKKVIGEIDLATEVIDVALSAPVVWSEDVYTDASANELYAKAGENYIPTANSIFNKEGSVITNPIASGSAIPGAIDSGRVLSCDAYNKSGVQIASKGDKNLHITDVYTQSGARVSNPFEYSNEEITVADWLSDTLNMPSTLSKVFSHDIIHGQVSIKHSDFIINDTGEVEENTISVYPEYDILETDSTATPLFAISSSGYQATLIGRTLFLKSPTATVLDGAYDGGTTTFMHWKKADLPVALNDFRNSFRTLDDEEFYEDITEVFTAISEELSARSSSEYSNLISSIQAIMTSFYNNGHIITLDEFINKYKARVEQGAVDGYTFRISGVSYVNNIAYIKPGEYTTYNITADPSVPANNTYNEPHYNYTYREMLLDFAEYVCGAADNTMLFTESAIKMYFDDDTLYIQTKNKDVLSITADKMTKRTDLEDPFSWSLVSLPYDISILSEPTESSSYKVVFQDKEVYIPVLSTRKIKNFADFNTTYDAGNLRIMGGKLSSAKAIKAELSNTDMTSEEISEYIKNLYDSDTYAYASPVLIAAKDKQTYVRVNIPTLKITNNGKELIVGKDFSAYISSIKKVGNCLYAFVKADLDNSGSFTAISQALCIVQDSEEEWSLAYPTVDNPETTPYDLSWVDVTTTGVSSGDLAVYAASNASVTSGDSKISYDDTNVFSKFTYMSALATRMNNAEISVLKVINGNVLLNAPLFEATESEMTFLVAIKTQKQVYDQTNFLNVENIDEYTNNGIFKVQSIIEVPSAKTADRMYNKREILAPMASADNGLSEEEQLKYGINDNTGYPSVSEDRHHIYYKYDIYGDDYYAKDWYNREHKEIKLCNIDGDYYVQNNPSTPVVVRYANTEKLLRAGSSVDIAFTAPYAEYDSVAAASRNEKARPMDEELSKRLTRQLGTVKEICVDNQNPYIIVNLHGPIENLDLASIQNYEKYVELNVYVPYIHSVPQVSVGNMLFNVSRTWEYEQVLNTETGNYEDGDQILKSGVIADLSEGLPVSAIYIPKHGYGSTRDNLLDWDAKDDYKPWTVDPKAFEYRISKGGSYMFTDLYNSVGKPVYMCNENGDLLKDSEGNLIVFKVPKYLDIGNLASGENGYEIEDSLVKNNEVLGSLEDSRLSIGYIELVNAGDNAMVTLKQPLELSGIDLNDGEKHTVLFAILPVEPVTISPKVMNNPEYFIEVMPYEKNIFGYDRIWWNTSGYPRSPIKIGNDIFYSQNNNKYEPIPFTDIFGNPVYECDSDGNFIGFAKRKGEDGKYSLVEKGSLGTPEGDMSEVVTAAHDLRFRPYTPKYSSCQDWFRNEFYLKGQEKNPYWQNIHIQANYNNVTMQYDQESSIQEYIKVGSTMNTKQLEEADSYITVQKPCRITTTRGTKTIKVNAPYLDCAQGSIDLIIVPAVVGSRYHTEDKPLGARKNKDRYVKYGISVYNPCDRIDNAYNIFSTDLNELNYIHSYFCGSWSINTLENFVDKTDKDKAITQINELGIFDKKGHLIVYATFPAIEYRTDTQHADFTIIVNNNKNIVDKSDTAQSIGSEQN